MDYLHSAGQVVDPGIPEAHYTLGLVYWQAGDFDQTAVEMRLAIALRPDYAEAYVTLGQALRIKGDLEGSKAAFAQGAKVRAKAEENEADMLKKGMAGDKKQ